MSIDVISPSDPLHGDLEKAVSHQVQRQGRKELSLRYNKLANTYNHAEVGSYLDLGRPQTTLSNLEKVFANRGLVRGRDYVLHRITRDTAGKAVPIGQRNVVLKRVTSAEMRLV